MSVAEALAALDAAEKRLADAERDRREADAQVDVALALAGWTRAAVAGPPGANFYRNLASGKLRTREEAIALAEAAA